MNYLTPKQVAEDMNINIATARNLFRYKNFPRVKGLGSKLLVEEEAYIKFIRNEEFKTKEK